MAYIQLHSQHILHPHPITSSRRQYTTVQEKIEAILELLHRWRWTIGDLLYYLFVMNGMTLKPSKRHCLVYCRVYTCDADDWQHFGARNSHQLLAPGISVAAEF